MNGLLFRRGRRFANSAQGRPAGAHSAVNFLSNDEFGELERRLDALGASSARHGAEQRAQIEAAKIRLRAGRIGVCSECSGTIGYQRLSANPLTELCIACQTMLDTLQPDSGAHPHL